MFDENSNNVMAMINHLMNVKDSRWLQVEVCREFQRGQCSRTDQECKFAHPQSFVEVQNGKVTACYDSIKGRCTRENPKCKYLHPPQHIKDQLLINGRNALALKNLLMSQLNGTGGAAAGAATINPLGVPTASPYLLQGSAAGLGAMQGQGALGQAMAYPYYLNPTALYSPTASYLPTPASPDLQSALQQQQAQAQAQAVKRVAVEKSGVPVYQPAAAGLQANQAQHGAAALQYSQLAAIPAGLGGAYIPTVTFTGHPPGVPRF